MTMFPINQEKIICRWWRYGKLSVMPVILKPLRRSNLRFWSLNKVSHDITREHDYVSMIYGLIDFYSFFQIKAKLETWSESFQESFDKKDYDRAVEATQRMRYYERALEETVKKLWSWIIRRNWWCLEFFSYVPCSSPVVTLLHRKFATVLLVRTTEEHTLYSKFQMQPWLVQGHFSRTSYKTRCIQGFHI